MEGVFTLPLKPGLAFLELADGKVFLKDGLRETRQRVLSGDGLCWQCSRARPIEEGSLESAQAERHSVRLERLVQVDLDLA